jgi:alpha-D-ribose 1-methylphosphonate 5-triphosphate synthase subunit PhnH
MVSLFNPEDFKRQRIFRVLLAALSRPGKVFQLPMPAPAPDLWSSLYLILETLLDPEVSYCLVKCEEPEQIPRNLFEGLNSPEDFLEKADFIVAPFGRTGGEIERAKRGRPDYPDQSATVLYRVHSFIDQGAASTTYRLQGPGIPGKVPLPAMEGFDYHDLDLLTRINQSYPLGIDTFFVCPRGCLMGLPRSTHIFQEEHKWLISQ